MNKKNYGYIRKHASDRKGSAQQEVLKRYRIDKWFKEFLSSDLKKEKPKLKELLATVEKGDTVYIGSFFCIAKSTADLVNTLKKIREKEAYLISIEEDFDMTTPNGQLQLETIFSIAAFEKKALLESQKPGIAKANKEKRYKGRSKIVMEPDEIGPYYWLWKKRRITKKSIAKKLNVSRVTLDRLFKEFNPNKNPFYHYDLDKYMRDL